MAFSRVKPMPDKLDGFDYLPFGVIWKDGRWQTLKWHSPDSEQARRNENNKYSKSIICCAPTRSGKLVSLISYALAGYNYGSYIATDYKGELAWYSIPCRRAMGQECHVLNGFNLHTDRADYMKTSRMNHLASLNPADPLYSVKLGAIAENTLVPVEGKDPFWHDGACNVFRGAMDALRRIRDDASIPDVAEMISPAYWTDALNIMAHASSAIARNVAAMYDPDNRNRTDGAEGQLQTLRTQTQIFYEVDPIRRMLSGKPDFSWEDVKRKNLSVFIVLPEGIGERFRALPRLLVGTALSACMALPRRPVFFEFDEFVHFCGNQPLSIVPVAINSGAYAGLRMRLVFHNIGQAIGIYGREGVSSLLSGAGLVQFFTPGVEMETPKLLSEFAGETSKLKVDPLNPERREWVSVPYWYPQDIRGMTHYPMPDGSTRPDVQWQCILREGEAMPLVAGRINYWNDLWGGFYTSRLQDRPDA